MSYNTEVLLSSLKVNTTLDSAQIKSILDKLVPLIAKPEDYEFFRGVLAVKAETSTAPAFGYFVAKLLKEAGK